MSDTFVELLIVAVRKANMLWDMTDKRYHNRLLVDREWTRIANELGETKATVKGKWKNLRDTFKKEFKKIPKPRSGDDSEEAARYTGSWCHFEAMLFLKRIAIPREMEGNLSAAHERSIVEHESQEHESQEHESQEQTYEEHDYSREYESQDKEFRELGRDSDQEEELAQHNESITEVSIPPKPTEITILAKPSNKEKSSTNRLQKELQELEKSLPAANSPRNPIQIPVSRKRKAKQTPNQENNFEQEMLRLEARKLDLLAQTDNDDEDINFFKSLLPHVRQLPSLNKLNFRTQVQNFLIQELTKIQNSVSYQYCTSPSGSSSSVQSPYCSPPSLFDL